jgi:hypothetical protein
MPVDTRTVLVSLAVNASIAAILFLVFSCARLGRFTRRFYAPRIYARPPRPPGQPHPPPPPSSLLPGQPHHHPPPPAASSSLLGWVRAAWCASEPQVVAAGGLASALYLRVLALGLRLCALLALLTWVLVLPANLSGEPQRGSPSGCL